MEQLKFKLYDGGCPPEKKTIGAAAWDICTDFKMTIVPGMNVIPLQIAFDIPEYHFLMLTPRSSTFGRHGFLCPESIIDEDYTGIIHGLIYNIAPYDKVFEGQTRLFQITLHKKIHAMCYEVEEIMKRTVRNDKGLGSTGI